MGTRNQLPDQQRRPVSYTRQPVQRLPRQPYPPASTHSAGYHSGIHPEDAPYLTVDMEPEEEDEQFYKERSRTSIRTYQQPLPPALRTRYDVELRPEILPSPVKARRSAVPQPTIDQQENVTQAQPRRHFHIHWLAFVGIGAVLALSLWIGAIEASNWWTSTIDDQTYTQAFRTFSIDQVVGHNHDSADHPSHFIVQNDKRHIVIIEFPANDATKAIVYPAPYLVGQGQDRVPVTISFQQNLQTGRLDMVLHVEDQTYTFFNTGTKFIPPPLG